MLEAAEGSYISIEPYTGRAMQAHMAMQVGGQAYMCVYVYILLVTARHVHACALFTILFLHTPLFPTPKQPKKQQISTSTAAEGAPKFDVWYPNVYKAEVIPTLWMSQVGGWAPLLKK